MNYSDIIGNQSLLSVPEKTTEELIKTYCSAIDNRLIVVIGIIFCMWLFETKLRNMLDKQVKEKKMHDSIRIYILNIYKWIGLGLLFIVGYALLITYG